VSELLARQHIQTVAQGISVFSAADVTLNDWSILDAPGALQNAPFLIVLIAEDFSTPYNTSGPQYNQDIIAVLFEAWPTDLQWPSVLENFGATRNALREGFNADSGNKRWVSGTNISIQDIVQGSPIFEDTRGQYTYMAQEIIFVTEDMS
jgi:hypothetical protein